MEDRKIPVSETVLREAAQKLMGVKIRYQRKVAESTSTERACRWESRSEEVDALITAIYWALEEAEEAEYQAMLKAEEA